MQMQPLVSSGLVIDRAERRRRKKSKRSVSDRRLSDSEVESMVARPVFKRNGEVAKVLTDRLGGPPGILHYPVSVSVYLDAKGREYRVINTSMIDIGAEIYRQKREQRAGRVEMKRAA